MQLPVMAQPQQAKLGLQKLFDSPPQTDLVVPAQKLSL